VFTIFQFLGYPLCSFPLRSELHRISTCSSWRPNYMLKTSRSLKIVTVSLLHAVCRCGLLLHILRCSRWRTHWRHLANTIERQCAVKMRPCAKLPLVLVNEKSSHKIHWRCYRFYDTSFESLVCRFVYDICSYMSITRSHGSARVL